MSLSDSLKRYADLALQAPSPRLGWLVAGAFLYGLIKSAAVRSALGGCSHSPGFGTLAAEAALEEMSHRVAWPAVLAGMGATSGQATLLSSALFGLAHVSGEHGAAWNGFRFADAALGGLLYTKAFLGHGFLGALAAHVAHNVGVYTASQCRGS